MKQRLKAFLKHPENEGYWGHGGCRLHPSPWAPRCAALTQRNNAWMNKTTQFKWPGDIVANLLHGQARLGPGPEAQSVCSWMILASARSTDKTRFHVSDPPKNIKQHLLSDPTHCYCTQRSSGKRHIQAKSRLSVWLRLVFFLWSSFVFPVGDAVLVSPLPYRLVQGGKPGKEWSPTALHAAFTFYSHMYTFLSYIIYGTQLWVCVCFMSAHIRNMERRVRDFSQ